MKREPLWIRVIQPPIVAVVTAVSTVYSLLFGWWLDDRVARRLDSELAVKLRENVGFLFTDKNGRIVASDDYQVKRAFDLSVVTVATDDLYVRFVTVRGDLDVEVASHDVPRRWEELSSVIRSAERSHSTGLREMAVTRRERSYSCYSDVERLLRSHWTLLTGYCRNSA